jgi:hypothetical protein
VVITHFLNIFFMLLLFRSGIEVLSAFPKFCWHDSCPPLLLPHDPDPSGHQSADDPGP